MVSIRCPFRSNFGLNICKLMCMYAYCMSCVCNVHCTVVVFIVDDDVQVANSVDDCGMYTTVLNVNCSVSMQCDAN